jgi:hypothetical protein
MWAEILFPAGSQLNQEYQTAGDKYRKGDEQNEHNPKRRDLSLTPAKVRNFYILL